MATSTSVERPDAPRKSFTVFTSSENPLDRPIQLLFVITAANPNSAIEFKDVKSFAWEVFDFPANQPTKTEARLMPSRHLSRYISQGSQITDHFSEEIMPGNYIELDGRLNWVVHPFFGGDSNKIYAINNSNKEQEFVLGTEGENPASGDPEFQPFILGRKLKAREGLAVKAEYYLQAFETKDYSRHQLITEDLTGNVGLLKAGDNVPCLNLDKVPERVEWQLISENGKTRLILNDSSAVPDLGPLRDALQKAVDILDNQIPKKNVKWGNAVLRQFARPAMPLLEEFAKVAGTLEGYDADGQVYRT